MGESMAKPGIKEAWFGRSVQDYCMDKRSPEFVHDVLPLHTTRCCLVALPIVSYECLIVFPEE
jgi:hypothetical protein